LEVLDRHNEDDGKLEHYLRASVKKRMVNRFKEITKSVKCPCLGCDFFKKKSQGKNTDCKKIKSAGTIKEPTYERRECSKWKNYEIAVDSRNSLLNPLENLVEGIQDDIVVSELIKDEMLENFRQYMSASIYSMLERYLNGENISKEMVNKIREECKDVLSMVYEGEYDAYTNA